MERGHWGEGGGMGQHYKPSVVVVGGGGRLRNKNLAGWGSGGRRRNDGFTK